MDLFITEPQHFVLQLPQQPVLAHGLHCWPFRFQRECSGGKLYRPGHSLTVLIFYQAGTADAELCRGAFLGPVQAPSPKDQSNPVNSPHSHALSGWISWLYSGFIYSLTMFIFEHFKEF